MQKPVLPARDAMGIPLTSEFDRFNVPILLYVVLLNLTLIVLGLAAAWPIFRYHNTTRVESKLALLAEHELGWLYLSIFVLRLGHSALTAIVVKWRKETKVGVPDHHAYKVFTPPGIPPLPYVFFENEGSLGCLNRAQRAVQNYLEYLPGMVAYTLLVGFVFPLPVFVCAAVYVAIRFMMAVQYTQATENRRIGFLLSSLTAAVVEGLLLLCGGQVLALQYGHPSCHA